MQGFPVQPFLQILAARMETMPLAQQWHPSEALIDGPGRQRHGIASSPCYGTMCAGCFKLERSDSIRASSSVGFVTDRGLVLECLLTVDC